jgi:hypothetical protein
VRVDDTIGWRVLCSRAAEWSAHDGKKEETATVRIAFFNGLTASISFRRIASMRRLMFDPPAADT